MPTPSQAKTAFEEMGFTDEESQNLKIRSDLMRAVQDYLWNQGLTNDAAAERLGVSASQIDNLRAGRIDLFDVDTLIAISRCAGIDISVQMP